MTKSKLRILYLDKQKILSNAERNRKSLQIADRFFEHFDLQNIRLLHVFLSIEKNNEIETSFFIKRLWQDFPKVETAVSRIDFQTMTLENLRFTPETKLVRNKWHISEPTGGELIKIKKNDAVLVPLLSFDERGFRVGYGKGLYDKFLSECRADCIKIGLSYFAPTVEISDTADFDVRLDFCITPEKIWEF